LGAVVQRRHARVEGGLQLAAQDRYLGAQLGNGGARLRLDQRALAIPLPALFLEDFAERFAPSIN
jgi:hypothetical protein